MRFTFSSLMLRIKFSWGIWAIYREIVLIQGAAQLEFYFLQMHSAHQEIHSTEEALSYWMKTRLAQSNTFLGCRKSLMRNINELNPKSGILLSLRPKCCYVSSQERNPPACPSCGTGWTLLPKVNTLTPSTPGHLCAAACASSVKHQN